MKTYLIKTEEELSVIKIIQEDLKVKNEVWYKVELINSKDLKIEQRIRKLDISKLKEINGRDYQKVKSLVLEMQLRREKAIEIMQKL